MHMKGSAAHRSHRFHRLRGAQDLHYPLEVVGQHIQAHFRVHIAQATSKEVGVADPMFSK